ncbi:Uma2 family endonuclease [Kitasatospora sp. NPDC096077]|uniref:Uma2 family endonuclease n=1 Tax=Kitasatospora sp. NPDC096077 TaxID=3155544 RepID=UPI003319136D
MTTPSARSWRVLEELDVPEGVRAELISGEILLSLSSDMTTNLIVASLIHQVPHELWYRLTKQDLAYWGCGSRLQPDLVVLESAAIDVAVAAMVVEVVSGASSLRDYYSKRGLYAEAGIPAYLIVDPGEAVCVLLTEPSRETLAGEPDYLSMRTSLFGEVVPVGALGVDLMTSEFPRGHSGRAVKSINSSTFARSSGSRSL